MRAGGLGVVAALVVASGCAGTSGPSALGPDPLAWPRLVHRLAELRSSRPTAPWAAGVRVEMNDPRTGRAVEGRGAIAVSPGRAVRMILVGGPGATVLDAWVTRDAWRIAVPPAGILRRGREDAPVDLPVGFLRWWLLSPLEGTPTWARRTEDGATWVLREGDAVVELHATEHAVTAVRRGREDGRSERVSEVHAGREPAAGDTAAYEDLSTGLRVYVTLEGRSPSPEDAAFADPDAPGGGS